MMSFVTEHSREHDLGWSPLRLMDSTLRIPASCDMLERQPALALLFTNELNGRVKPAA